ncbi:MAG: DNA topoisomerase [Chloroflexota bacterium]
MQLRITEKTVLTPGYRRAYSPARDETVAAPRLAEKRRGERVRVQTRLRKATLTEADLIRRMQGSGVGRPSTYAATLEALRRHGYIETQEGTLRLTPRGREVLRFLEARYPFLLDPEFSARLEAQLDSLACGRGTYRVLLARLWRTLQGEQ